MFILEIIVIYAGSLYLYVKNKGSMWLEYFKKY